MREGAEKAYDINVKLAKHLAILSNEVGADFIQISTDQVFDGEKRLYTELDVPIPLINMGSRNGLVKRSALL